VEGYSGVVDRADLIVDFLNSRDVRAFGEHADHPEVDEIGTPQTLKRWLLERGRLKKNATVSADDHRAALRLRNGLREVLWADSDDVDDAANAVARRFPLTVTFSAGQPHLGRTESGVRAYLADILGACALAEADGSWRLIKMCAADDCHWVFVDRSRNRMGRWCATDVCGNRMKTRRYRARLRTT
jgi:predicted RNA-binding Zn ribbon-like protein